MKSLTVSAVLTLAVFLVTASPGAVAQDSAAPAAPAISKPKALAVLPVKDLGKVSVGETLEVDFEIRNGGDAELQITEVRPACGCTVVEYDAAISPGQVGKVHATLDTSNLNGPVSKTITVFTNDPENPALVLTLTAEIHPFIAAMPGYARFITVQGEGEGRVAQNLWSKDGEPMKVTGVESPSPFLTAEYHIASEEELHAQGEGQQWLVELILKENAPVGAINDYVTILVDHPKQSQVRLPVSGFVRPILAVTPPVADFEEIEVVEPLRASLQIRSFASEDIQLTSVESSVEAVQAEIVQVEAGRRYQLRVVVSPEIAKGPFLGVLTVKTDSPKVPELLIELKGTVI